MPPPDFRPPFAIESGSNGIAGPQFRFNIRKQLTSHLCVRRPGFSGCTPAASDEEGSPVKPNRGATASAAAPTPVAMAPSRMMGGGMRGGGGGGGMMGGGVRRDSGESDEDDCSGADGFGFVYLDEPQSFRQFAATADWIKARHFSDPPPKVRRNPNHLAVEVRSPITSVGATWTWERREGGFRLLGCRFRRSNPRSSFPLLPSPPPSPATAGHCPSPSFSTAQ